MEVEEATVWHKSVCDAGVGVYSVVRLPVRRVRDGMGVSVCVVACRWVSQAEVSGAWWFGWMSGM